MAYNLKYFQFVLFKIFLLLITLINIFACLKKMDFDTKYQNN